MKKTILALLLAGATWVTGCGSSNDFDAISGQPGTPQPIITPTPQPTTGYFVDAFAGNDATGSFSSGAPYATIQAAVTAAPTNAVVTVRAGSYSGSVTLKNGQQLLGASGARPVITGQLILGDDNTVDYLSFQGINDDAIDGEDQDSGTVTNCEFANTTNFGNGLRALSVTGTWVVEDNVMSNLAGIGVEISATSGDSVIAQVNSNTITGSAFCAIGFGSGGTGNMRIQANGNNMSGNQPGATFEVITSGTSDIVLQMVGNTNNDVYRFSRNVTTSNLRVERLGQLTTLNSGGATVNEVLEPVTPVNNGDAGFGNAP